MLWLFLTYNVKMEDNNMIKTTVKVDGMMCGMCESHVNDAVRKVFQPFSLWVPCLSPLGWTECF